MVQDWIWEKILANYFISLENITLYIVTSNVQFQLTDIIDERNLLFSTKLFGLFKMKLKTVTLTDYLIYYRPHKHYIKFVLY